MDYRRIYLSICANAKKEMIGGLRPSSYKEKKCFKKYFEFHHVLPKSLFPRWTVKRSHNLQNHLQNHLQNQQLNSQNLLRKNKNLTLY